MTSGSKIAVVMGSSKGVGKAVPPAFAKSREYGRIAVN
jgi:NAD(P)-dependent dehydrogenase (short-subunit alcohol dehydrogenase family)